MLRTVKVRARLALLLLFASACGGSASELPPPPPLDANDQTPPTGSQEALDAWLAAGSYKAWACEPVRHDAGNGSGHSASRICTNTKQSTHTSTGAFPVGAASVKELYDGDVLEGYAVYVRAADGDGGEKRFWYERIGTSVIALGFGHTTCIGCHSGAPKDYVFTVAPRP